MDTRIATIMAILQSASDETNIPKKAIILKGLFDYLATVIDFVKSEPALTLMVIRKGQEFQQHAHFGDLYESVDRVMKQL